MPGPAPNRLMDPARRRSGGNGGRSPYSSTVPAGSSKPVAEAVAETARVAKRDKPARGRGRASDVFGGELRRRDVFPLLVLHLVSREPSFGNRLIEEIEGITQGVITVNPNTMYPLLRQLESEGRIEGRWE